MIYDKNSSKKDVGAVWPVLRLCISYDTIIVHVEK